MSRVTVRWDTTRLLDYAKAGKVALKDLKIAMRKVGNAGRASVRQLIASQFGSRTGVLRKQARAIRVTATARESIVSARVGPLPNLLNIYEHGAKLPRREVRLRNASVFRFMVKGEVVFARGTMLIGGVSLAPRVVMGPSLRRMEAVAREEVGHILDRIGVS